MQVTVEDRVLELVQGDVTRQEVDAIVNAANSRLAGGGGVDGAIHRAGGTAIMEETRCRYPNGCPTGSAVVSGAGDLPAKYVFHAVGPVWRGGSQGEDELLRGAYRTCLELAAEHGCRSLAFPSLSTGAYGYPIEEASRIALTAALDFLKSHELPQVVRFVLFSKDDYDVFRQTLEALKPSG